VADDIVTDCEGMRLIAWSLEGGNVKMAEECRRAADEIERLRAALAIAAGMISTYPPYEREHPETIMEMLLEEARRG